MHALDVPPAVIRVDPAPGFTALRNDETLHKFNLVLDIGRTKKHKQKPSRGKAIAELEDELLPQDSSGDSVSKLSLSLAVARLNSRIRFSGLSSRELMTKRSQFTNEQIPVSNRDDRLF